MTNRKSTNSGCCSTVLSRLLCSGSPQTHPSDRFPDLVIPDVEDEPEKEEKYFEPEIEQPAAVSSVSVTAPSIVARLMGLDSLPETNWVQKTTATDSVTRSKSANFTDYLFRFDADESQHRRVKATLSFREVACPTRQLQKHDFLLLYLDKLEENKDGGLKPRKPEKGMEERSKEEKPEKAKDRSNKKVQKFKDEPRRVCKNKRRNNKVSKLTAGLFSSPRKKEGHRKSTSDRTKDTRNKIEDSDTDCSSEHSSPVSVLELDLDEYLIHDEYSLPGESGSVGLKPKSKSSQSKPKKKDSEDAEYLIKLTNLLRKLSEEDIKESTWVSASPAKFEDLEDLCADFGQEMVDLILLQIVEELVEMEDNSKTIALDYEPVENSLKVVDYELAENSEKIADCDLVEDDSEKIAEFCELVESCGAMADDELVTNSATSEDTLFF